MDDYSYLGAGRTYIREWGSAAPFLEIGNVSALNYGVTEQGISLRDYTQAGGGTRNKVSRIESVTLNATMHDLSPQNLARAFLGGTSTHAAAAITAEEVVAYAGGFTPLEHVPTSITSVAGPGGTPNYTDGDDYEFRDGGIYIPEGSTIPAPVDGAVNLEVTYSTADQDTVQAITASAKDYELVFVGLNEARSGKAVRSKAHKVKFSPAQALALISADEHAALEVAGEVQSDSTVTGAGVSKFFSVTMVK